MQFKSIYQTVLIMIGLFASCANAQTPSDQLATRLNSFQSMQATFTQNLLNGRGKIMQKNTGKMALQRPGKFRWETKTANHQLLIADGRYLWIYDVDLQQATKQKLDNTKSTNPASLLIGSVSSLQQRFVVTTLNQPGEWYQLKPKGKNEMFQWIQLQFQNNMLKEMRLSDNLGQVSNIMFSNVKINPPLNSALFTFKPPKGVDVIKQ